MNDDLISRSALRKDIERLYSVYKDNKDYFYTDVLDHIDNAPTVDTTCPNCDSGYAQGYSDGYLKGKEERPQGEWIMKNDYTFDCNLCGCSCLDKNNYCPDCGAEMS